MSNRDTYIELIATASTIVVLGVGVFYGSAYGAKGLYGTYGGTEQFGLETMIAITAYRWTPFLFAAVLIGYIWLRVCHGRHQWASWCALSLAALVTAFVLYGIVLPYESTTFSMGNQ